MEGMVGRQAGKRLGDKREKRRLDILRKTKVGRTDAETFVLHTHIEIARNVMLISHLEEGVSKRPEQQRTPQKLQSTVPLKKNENFNVVLPTRTCCVRRMAKT